MNVRTENKSDVNCNIFPDECCPICKAQTKTIYHQRHQMTKMSTWETESTMVLLDLKKVDSKVNYCKTCQHFYRLPFFDESKIYGDQAYQCRKETFKKYNPDLDYVPTSQFDGRKYFNKQKEIFAFLAGVFEQLEKGLDKDTPSQSLKMLDWGGGDGYLAEVAALTSRKVLKVPAESYCYDYHNWDVDSKSPYFQYVSQEKMNKEKYDVIFCSHVLEHVADPKSCLEKVKSLLHPNGILFVALPFDVHCLKSSQCCQMHYHQFSLNDFQYFI